MVQTLIPSAKINRNIKPGYILNGQPVPATRLEPALYLVATPIGNLRDITLRALDTLAGADLIAAEDTRVSRVLLNHYGINRPLIACHEHSQMRQVKRICSQIAAGGAVALISDAGTPLISDPGQKLVSNILDEGHKIISIPGPNAPITALVSSGLSTESFIYAGFPPAKDKQSLTWMTSLIDSPHTIIFFETARRLNRTLAHLASICDDNRAIVVARELTKKFETIHRGTVSQLQSIFNETPARGELVILIEPAESKTGITDDQALDSLLETALAEASLRDAAKLLAEKTGRPRKEIYQRGLALSASRK